MSAEVSSCYLFSKREEARQSSCLFKLWPQQETSDDIWYLAFGIHILADPIKRTFITFLEKISKKFWSNPPDDFFINGRTWYVTTRHVITKGQLISKCPFGVFKSPNKTMKFLCRDGRKSSLAYLNLFDFTNITLHFSLPVNPYLEVEYQNCSRLFLLELFSLFYVYSKSVVYSGASAEDLGFIVGT